MNAISYIKRFRPHNDMIANVIAVSTVVGIAMAALLTMDESICVTKFLKLAGGAVAGGLAGLILPRLFDIRKW